MSSVFDLSDESFNGPRHAAPVVFVDDDELVLKAISRLFQFQPYQAVTFREPGRALDYLRENAVQVLVSDLRMPEMDGLELLRRAQEARPEVVRVVLSAYSDRESLLDAINNGHIYRYILKPWDAVELISVVRQSVDLFNLRRENQRLAEALRSISVREVVGDDVSREPRGVTLLQRYGAYVASELSNPVAAFERVASLGSRVSSEQRIPRAELLNYIGTIGEAAAELEAIRRDLVDDALLLGLAREMDLDLNTAIQRVSGELAESRGGLGVVLKEDLDPELPAVLTSPILLSRLLTELIAFAVDHVGGTRPDGDSESEPAALRLQTRREGDRVRLSIHCGGEASPQVWADWRGLLEKLARANGASLRIERTGEGNSMLRVDFPGSGRAAASTESGA
ncbi:MAG: response regulator [Spirochaetaceae bacterium]